MRAAVFCVCFLGCVSFSASKGSETGNSWDDFPSDESSMAEPSQEMKETRHGYILPAYVKGDDAAAVKQQKKWFHYTNRGPLTAEAKEVMLPTTTKAPVTPKIPNPMVETRCYVDRMYVRVRKDAVHDPMAKRRWFFGNCRVNAERGIHFYFLYYITSCGLKPQVMDDAIVYTNLVRYMRKPTNPLDIIRDPTSTIVVPVSCRFPRFQRTYNYGIHPSLGPKLSLPLPAVGSVSTGNGSTGDGSITIAVLDAFWKPLPPGASFQLGQAMNFEIRAKGRQRVFPNECWFESASDLNTTYKYTVITNYGCMVDSKNSIISRYYYFPNPSVLRLTIESFVFPYVGRQLMSLRCKVTTGPIATLYRKACTYNDAVKMWYELDTRNNMLCLCCETACPAPRTGLRSKTVSSESWITVESKALGNQGVEAGFDLDDGAEFREGAGVAFGPDDGEEFVPEEGGLDVGAEFVPEEKGGLDVGEDFVPEEGGLDVGAEFGLDDEEEYGPDDMSPEETDG